MTNGFAYMLLLASMFLMLFGVAEVFYRRFQIPSELTRKMVHLFTGLFTFLFPLWLHTHWQVLTLCAVFAIILLVSLKSDLLPSINGIERKSVGSLAYPISVYICFVVSQHHNWLFFYLPIAILAISDPLAALIGKKWRRVPYRIWGEYKTVSGSFAFLISSWMLSSFLLDHYDRSSVIITGFVVALAATFSEALSTRGLDNITIPAVVILTLKSLEWIQ